MQPFVGDLEGLVDRSDDFRRVIHTGAHSQLVTMTLQPGEEIGLETHDVDQLFIVVKGVLEARLDGARHEVRGHGLVLVPAGTVHNFTNIGPALVRLVTVYSPPQHPDGTVHRTRADAMRAEAEELQPA